MKPIAAVVIPSYMEDDNLNIVTKYLLHQTMINSGKSELIIVQYLPDSIPEIHDHWNVEKTFYLKHIITPQKGISYARNLGITNTASTVKVIVNMDADSVFNRRDALELMTAPILDGKSVLTNCDVYQVENIDIEMNQMDSRHHTKNIMRDILHSTYLDLEKHFPVAHAQGQTFLKTAWQVVGGFWDHVMEDYNMAYKICTTYGILQKQWIKDVCVFTSNRRIRPHNPLALFDYSKAYRGNREFKV